MGDGRGVEQALLTKGMIFNIQKYSVHDGPGIRTTVFLKGCPLQCWWCHNPEGLSADVEVLYRQERCLACGDCVDACPHGAIQPNDGKHAPSKELCMLCGTCLDVCMAEARELVGKEVTVDDVVREILQDRVFFDESEGGVTFSGGEPMLQPDFLSALLQVCRSHDIHTAVETAGFTSVEILRRVSEDTNLFLYDLKAFDNTVHKQYTGVSNDVILENLQKLSSWGKDVVVRMPVIPGVNDDEVNIAGAGRFLAQLTSILEVHLLPFHTTGKGKYARLEKEYRLPPIKPSSPANLDEIAARLERFGLSVKIGG